MKLNLLLSVACAAGLIACDNRSSTAADKTAEPTSRTPSAPKRPKPAPRSPQARRDPAPGVVIGGIAFPPAGEHRADLLTLGMSKEASKKVEAIARKFQQSMAADPAWFESYLKEADTKPGALPYHPKMGITEEEYATMRQASNGMTLVKVSDAVVRFSQEQGKVTMHIEGVELPADTFVFSADGQTMECSLGASEAPTAIDQKKVSSPTGPWKGSQWAVKIGSPTPSLTGTDDAYEVKVAIGKDTRKRNLIYVGMTGRRDQGPMDITYILRWPQ